MVQPHGQQPVADGAAQMDSLRDGQAVSLTSLVVSLMFYASLTTVPMYMRGLS